MTRFHTEAASIAWRPAGATLAAIFFGCTVFCLPDLTNLMQYHRGLVLQGEVWRVVTSHWTHWSGEHLLWDILAFTILLFLSLRISIPRTIATLAASSILIPVAVMALQPDITEYRGLSGLDSALYMFVGFTLLRQYRSHHDRMGTILMTGVLACFAAKVIFELMTGQTIFVVSMGPGISGVPLAHIVGAMTGYFFTLFTARS